MGRIRVLLGVCAALLALAAVAGAQAQTYPNRPVKMILPFAAGGAGDVFARPLAQALSEVMGQQFVIENVPGAAAQIGTRAASKTAPDGYTLLMISNAVTINETLSPKRGYDLLKDFVPITQLNAISLVLVVHPKFPAKTVGELIAYAKERPGKLNFASSGVGSIYHLPMELLKSMSGIDMVHVPYKASGNARIDVLAGEPPMMIDGLVTMQGSIKANQVRALALTGAKRIATMPEVPTIAETLPGFEGDAWLGFMAPAGTPPEIVGRLQAEIAKIVARPEFQASYRTQQAVPVTSTPAEFAAFLRKDIEKWAGVIKTAGVPIQQ
jgi:tripartite-type tricarboxylate transporter receptor subunit TctC